MVADISVLALTVKSLCVITMSECPSVPKKGEAQSLSCCTTVTTTPPRCIAHSWCLAGNDGTEENKQKLLAATLPTPSRYRLDQGGGREGGISEVMMKEVSCRWALVFKLTGKDWLYHREAFFHVKTQLEGTLFVPRQSLVLGLTVCMYSNDEVISHGFGLSQLVGVAIMDHVIAKRRRNKMKKIIMNIHKSCISMRHSSCRMGLLSRLQHCKKKKKKKHVNLVMSWIKKNISF